MELLVGMQHYEAARKLGMKEYNRSISKGMSGYLPFLEGLIKNVDIVSEIDLGIIDVPLNKIVGTYTFARSTAFAPNFMPLLHTHTEFATKWSSLCNAHLEEGIRDSVKAYEYMNWFYILEGNKRISVLKYFNASSFTARVNRLIPKKDESDIHSRIYYEFLDFYRKTGVNSVWFSLENSFSELLGYMDRYTPSLMEESEKYKEFILTYYAPFSRLFHELNGDSLEVTTGDAFLEYLRLFGLPINFEDEHVRARLRLLITELKYFNKPDSVTIQTKPTPSNENKLISTLSTLIMPKRKLKVAFLYAKTPRESSWTFSHDLGRMHVEKVMKDEVEIKNIYRVPENISAYEKMKKIAEGGFDIVFTTNPTFINATLKTALEYPDTKFFNCSESRSLKHVTTYFGRIYESRFLSGMIAGAMSRSNILGYVGTLPIPGVISGINAFTLGARTVNPHVKVHVEWTRQWDSFENSLGASKRLYLMGADIISHHNTLNSKKFSKDFGLYTVGYDKESDSCIPGEVIAAPVWNWGIFYEKILRSIINYSLKPITGMFSFDSRLTNFWWGMDAGIVDIFYSSRLVPRETQKLVNFMQRMIANDSFHPFTGPIYDIHGECRIEEAARAGFEEILSMNWFTEGVECDPEALTEMQVHIDSLTGSVEVDA